MYVISGVPGFNVQFPNLAYIGFFSSVKQALVFLESVFNFNGKSHSTLLEQQIR